MDQEFGQRLLPNLIDDIARSSPERVFAVVAKDADPKDGLEDITYSTLSRAINRCAWWLEGVLGSNDAFRTITYMGPLDLLYPVLMLAATKTGYKALFTAPGNTLEAQLSLYEKTECTILLTPKVEPPMTTAILAKKAMQVENIPDLAFFLQPDTVSVYPYGKTVQQARYEPLVVMHTSGSSGLPKPVVVPHGLLCCFDAYNLLAKLEPKPTFFDLVRGTKILMGFPMFHLAGIMYLIGFGAFYGVTCVLPAPTGPLTASIADSLLEEAQVKGTILPPTVLVDLYKLTTHHTNIRRLAFCAYTGGSLPRDIGNEVTRMTRLITLTGSTEWGLYPRILCEDPDDWAYVHYTQFDGHDFRPHEIKGLHEHFFVKQHNLDAFQGIFQTRPDLKEYATQELYEKHPTKPDLWLIRGRADDIIVFSNAEKFNPGEFETSVEFHPAVNSAVVAGQGKPQPLLLVEPVKRLGSQEDRVALMNEIWPTVQKANQNSPSHAMILKDFIIVSDPEKPFLRAGKGTVQRNLTLESYNIEIDDLYKNMEMPNMAPSQILDLEEPSTATLEELIRRFVSDQSLIEDNLNRESDLFEHGLDSLKTVALCKQLNAFIAVKGSESNNIDPQVIYNNPSIDKLEMVFEQGNTASTASLSHQETLDSLLSQYAPYPEKPNTVLLTGSTGSLGFYLLIALLQDPSVNRIILLNRSKNAQERCREFLEARGLELETRKATFLTCNFSQPRFGIEDADYDDLADSVTHIIHNAWDVNFNRSAASFGPTHLNGVREMINFSLCAQTKPTLLFVSTEGAVNNLSAGPDIIHEQLYYDWNVALPMGYTQAKLVAERMIGAASQHAGLKSMICRVGQIAGPSTGPGAWSLREWIPSLIAASVQCGKIPASLGPRDVVNWVPVDLAATTLLELLLEAEPKPPSPPQPTSSPNLVNGTAAADVSPEDKVNGLLEKKPDLQTNGVPPSPQDHETPNEENHPPLSPARAQPPTPPPSSKIYHVLNPNPTTWSSLLPCITSHFPSPPSIIPYTDWLSHLKASLNNHSPAISKDKEHPQSTNSISSLLPFLEALEQDIDQEGKVMDVREAVKGSRTLSEMQGVGEVWMGVWMRQWGFGVS